MEAVAVTRSDGQHRFVGAKLSELLDPKGQGYLVEQRVPLSESKLWTLQRAFYASRGHEIWADASVPHYITSNPVIADAQAQVMVGFLRDLRAAGTLEIAQRVDVLEMGSGAGRFGFLFIERLRWLIAHSALADVTVRLIMTDFTEAMAAKLARHPQLAILAEQGVVDFAQFDAANPGPLELLHSGETLRADLVTGPLVVLANYVLDSLPQDCVAFQGGQARHGLLTVRAAEAFNVSAPASTPGDLDLTWDYVGMEGPRGEGMLDAEWSRVVEDYATVLDDTAVLLPTAALACVSYLSSHGSRLFLFTDKGNARTGDLMDRGDPGVAWHGGCFSMMVNFDGLGRCITERGGLALHPWHQPAHVVCAAYVLGGGAGSWPETELAYLDHLAEAGPDDFFTLQAAALSDPGSLTLSQMLTYLRISRFDPVVFLACFSPLLDIIAAAPAYARPDVARVVRAVWAQYFAIGEQRDFAVCVGLVLCGLHYYDEAQPYFERSIAERGVTADSALGLAICANGLGDAVAALEFCEQSLALDPSLTSARSLRDSVAAQVANTLLVNPMLANP